MKRPLSSVAHCCRSHVSGQRTVSRDKAEHHHIAHLQTATPERENETDSNKKVSREKAISLSRLCNEWVCIIIFIRCVHRVNLPSPPRREIQVRKKKQLVCL